MINRVKDESFYINLMSLVNKLQIYETYYFCIVRESYDMNIM